MTDFVNATFTDFQSAKTPVVDYCRTNNHPIIVDMTEKIASYNKKVKDDSKIRALPETAIYTVGGQHICC